MIRNPLKIPLEAMVCIVTFCLTYFKCDDVTEPEVPQQKNVRSELGRNVNNKQRDSTSDNNFSHNNNADSTDIDEPSYPNVPLNSTDDSLRYSNTYNHLPPRPQPGNGHYSPRNVPPRHSIHGRDSQEYQRDNRYGNNERFSQNDEYYYRQSNSNYGVYNNNINQRNQQPQYQQQYEQQRYQQQYEQQGYQQQQYQERYQQPYLHQHPRTHQEASQQEYYDDNDMSFVSESRLLPVNPWSSSDMLSKLIPLGSSVESNTRSNRSIQDLKQPQKNYGGKNELEQSLASDSLLVYLGNRTPLVESTVDKNIYPSSSSQKVTVHLT